MSKRYTEKDCVYCHTPFLAKRKDTLYCGRTCEQYAYLRRKRKKEAVLDKVENKPDTTMNLSTIKNTVKRIFDGYYHLCLYQFVEVSKIYKILEYSESCLKSESFKKTYINSEYSGIIEDIRSELLFITTNSKGSMIAQVIQNNNILNKKELLSNN